VQLLEEVIGHKEAGWGEEEFCERRTRISGARYATHRCPPGAVDDLVDLRVNPLHVGGWFEHVVQFRRGCVVDEPAERGDGDFSIDWEVSAGQGELLRGQGGIWRELESGTYGTR
jgi:hypothetical protein